MKLKEKLNTLLGVALLLAMGATLFWVLKTGGSWFLSQSIEVIAAAITVFGTVTAGIGAVVVSQQRIKSREIAEAHRPQKAKVYESFLSKVIEFMRNSDEDELGSEDMESLEEFFYEFTANVMMWGSPKVLKAYGTFKGSGGSNESVFLVDDIIGAMRKDLGLKNSGLKRGDLVKLLINDPENLTEPE